MNKTAVSIFALVVLAVPISLLAQTPLVPCEGDACNVCHVVELGQNILTWLISIIAVVIALVFAIGGLKMVMAGGNTEQVTSATKMMTNAVIGFVILLGAWLIVDTVIKTFVRGADTEERSDDFLLGPWNQIECEGSPTGAAPPGDDEELAEECSDPDALVAEYGGSPQYSVAAGMHEMMLCYEAGLALYIDPTQIFTYDQSNPLCGPTNGNPVCGACSHSVNSCHYGRGSGRGAMAVDYNASFNHTEEELYEQLLQKQAECGGTVVFEGDHTHISLPGC